MLDGSWRQTRAGSLRGELLLRCDVTMAGATQQPEVGGRVAAASASRVNVIDFVGVVDCFLAATTRPTISCGNFLLHELCQTPLVGLATPSTVWSFTQGKRLIMSASRHAHSFPRPDRLQPLQAIKQWASRSRNPPNQVEHEAREKEDSNPHCGLHRLLIVARRNRVHCPSIGKGNVYDDFTS